MKIAAPSYGVSSILSPIFIMFRYQQRQFNGKFIRLIEQVIKEMIDLIVTVHQPEHLPWLGFFHKMSLADCIVLLDNVQYRKDYFQNRNRIMSTNGPMYLTVPVVSKNRSSTLIKDILINGESWKPSYLRTLYYFYKNHPYFEQYYDGLHKIVSESNNRLSELNISIIKYFMKELDLNKKVYIASEMDVTGSKSELMLSICQKLNATVYLSGPTGREYLNQEIFQQNRINVMFHHFQHPSYPQLRNKQFVSHLSTIDLLFNCGSKSKDHLF